MNLSPESKRFMEFFIDDFESYYRRYTNHVQKELDNIYHSLFKQLVSASNYMSLVHLSGKLTEVVIRDQTPLSHLVDANVIPDDIRKFIKNEATHYLVYECKVLDRLAKIVFVLYTDEELLRLDTYDMYARMMFMWIKMASVCARINCSRVLTVYCYMTPFKKELPTNLLRTIGTAHCNSAVTYSCRQKNEICIYRKEEFFKVFIHETFHAFGLDFSELSQTNINQQIREIFPLDIEFNSFEAYCEFWATIINCAFCAYNIAGTKCTRDEFGLYIDFCIRFERMFSLFQLNKVLRYMSLDYTDLYEDTQVSRSLRQTLYKENTNVFSYYILKSLLLYYYPEFLSWCNRNNCGLYKFSRYRANVLRFLEFIKKYKENLELREDLVLMRIKASDYATLLGISNLAKTMRMTMCAF